MQSNFGITPSGRKFYRGEAVLCRVAAHVLCGHISEIDTPGDVPGDEVTVDVTLMTGVLNSMDTGDKTVLKTPIDRVTGFYHQSTNIRRQGDQRQGLLFCFADEEPNWLNDGPFVTRPIFNPAPEPEPEPVFHPADTNKDGIVDKAERKAWNKQHPDDPIEGN